MAPATARGGQCPDGGGFAHARFAEQAARRPEAVAVTAGRVRVTYRELDESSSRLAHYPAGIGVGPEIVAGVHLERGFDLIRVMLAVMKAGGAIGIGIGGVLSGDSLFGRRQGAAAIAVADMGPASRRPAARSSTRRGTAPSSARSAPRRSPASGTWPCSATELSR
jgi:acyl-coenzyme A synthetase/AMP-(fatty) acid ligase